MIRQKENEVQTCENKINATSSQVVFAFQNHNAHHTKLSNYDLQVCSLPVKPGTETLDKLVEPLVARDLPYTVCSF